MLINLHVKNLAIIDEVEVDFSEGMNVLTGETGAGKSIIIGSINLALGGKVSKDIIRKGKESALVELLFSIESDAQRDAINELGIDLDDDSILISRKLTRGRSINRVNGESVTLSMLKEIAAVLIDIHGQNEQQSLLHKSKHMEIVDRYAKDMMKGKDDKLSESYRKYKELLAKKDSSDMSEEERLRDESFVRYELDEIKDAALVHGEEEKLAEEYKKLSNASSIAEGLGEIYSMTGSGGSQSVSDSLGYSLRIINKLCEYDDEIGQFASQLSDIDELVSDFNREISDFIDGMELSGERLDEVEKRLDRIRNIKAKYGGTTEKVNEYAKELQEKLDRYQVYEEYQKELDEKIEKELSKLKKLSEEVSAVRKKCAKVLEKKITDALIELNFLQVNFKIEVRPLEEYTVNGIDEIEFMISTNPGEDMKPIGQAASGGELSRIMLAVKAVLAEHDEISTLIFDEIDVGISGRTAQKVAEKMALIAGSHQVICISHLAQIAAMADAHYLIEKNNDDNHTSTDIKLLSDEKSVDELARILGGVQITDAVIESAKEMKLLAGDVKEKIRQ